MFTFFQFYWNSSFMTGLFFAWFRYMTVLLARSEAANISRVLNICSDQQCFLWSGQCYLWKDKKLPSTLQSKDLDDNICWWIRYEAWEKDRGQGSSEVFGLGQTGLTDLLFAEVSVRSQISRRSLGWRCKFGSHQHMFFRPSNSMSSPKAYVCVYREEVQGPWPMALQNQEVR